MIWYISNALDIVYMVLFLCVNLKPKKNRVATFFAIYIPFSALGLSQKAITSVSPIIIVAIGWIIFVGLAWIMFEDSPKSKLFVILADMVISYAVSSITVVIDLLVTGEIQNIHISIVIVFHTLNILIMSIFTIIRKKLYITKYYVIAFAVMGVTQLLFAEVAALFMAYGGNPFNPAPPTIQSGSVDSFVAVVIAVAAVLYVVSDLILFILMKKLSQSEKAKEELRFREYKNRMNLDYYKSIEKNAEETRKLRHDMANILQIASSLVEGDDRDKKTSEQLLSQIRKEISEIHLEKYTDNSLVNAIVSNKAAVCRENGITYDFDIRIPEKIGLEEIDICKAYVNIIDNAVNAVLPLQGEKRSIELKSYIEGGNLFIVSKNFTLPEDEQVKKKAEGHGLGHKILADIADKYGGDFLTEQVDDVYNVLLEIKLNNA